MNNQIPKWLKQYGGTLSQGLNILHQILNQLKES